MSAASIVNDYVTALPGETRRLGPLEWGVTVRADSAAGWPLDLGVRIADGMLRVQAFALAADDAINPWNFLHWNRDTRLIRFGCTRTGDIWVHGDLPVAAIVDERAVDRILGLVAEAAIAARRAMTREAVPGATGWGAAGAS
jgi:Putative bacterial sensory transduction regulator